MTVKNLTPGTLYNFSLTAIGLKSNSSSATKSSATSEFLVFIVYYVMYVHGVCSNIILNNTICLNILSTQYTTDNGLVKPKTYKHKTQDCTNAL